MLATRGREAFAQFSIELFESVNDRLEFIQRRRMITWILVAAMGVILSFFGLRVVFRKYRRAEVSRRYFYAIIVGLLSFVTYALLSSIRPEMTSGVARAAKNR